MRIEEKIKSYLVEKGLKFTDEDLEQIASNAADDVEDWMMLSPKEIGKKDKREQLEIIDNRLDGFLEKYAEGYDGEELEKLREFISNNRKKLARLIRDKIT